MNPLHVPPIDLRYWLALCLASILGCNTGDYFASFFGFWMGLPILVALFAGVLVLEKRHPGASAIHYWLAIIVVRTAATNLADLASKRLGLFIALLLLTALLLAALFTIRQRQRAQGDRTVNSAIPAVDLFYWATMLIAGTLGTALSDFASFKSGLGLGGASLLLSGLVAILIVAKLRRPLALPATYWWVVVAIRAAGTSVGDFFARHAGLWQSMLAFGVAFAVFVTVSRRGALRARQETR